MNFKDRAERGIKDRGHFDIADVKASVDIVDVIGMFVPLKKIGREYKGQCPFHPDRDPSFTVVPHLGDHGQFKCFPCGAGGDVIDFVVKIKGCDIRTACKFLVGDQALTFMDADRERIKKQAAAKQQADDQAAEKRRRDAYAFWCAGKPAAGSPAEAYLRHRGITLPVPAQLRFASALWCAESNADRPAMLAAMVDGRGTFRALHRTYLARATEVYWRKAALETPKKILGRFLGAAVRLRDVTAPGSRLYVAEGIETALSVLEGLALLPEAAARSAVWAAGSLINMSRLALPSDEVGACCFSEVVLCIDADMSDGRALSTEIANAEVNYGARGCAVLVASPDAGQDFNDMLQGAA